MSKGDEAAEAFRKLEEKLTKYNNATMFGEEGYGEESILERLAASQELKILLDKARENANGNKSN